MRLIAHRANLNGSSPKTENSPEAIQQALAAGYQVEVDVWADGRKLMLGHDKGVYPTTLSYLSNSDIIVHCKNAEALMAVYGSALNYFWHQDDDYTVSSHGDLLIKPSSLPVPSGIILMPELSPFPLDLIKLCAGVCTDKPSLYRTDNRLY